MTSPNIRIDRLSLRVTGLDENAARELAELVALRLADGEFLTAMSAGGFGGSSPRANTGAGLDRLSVSVKTPDTKPDALAQHIVGEIYRAMDREVIP